MKFGPVASPAAEDREETIGCAVEKGKPPQFSMREKPIG